MKRLGLTLCVLAAFSAAAYWVLTHPDIEQVERLESEVAKLDEQNRDLAAENDALERKVAALRDDPRLAERKAREAGGLARPDELVFQFDKPEAKLEVDVGLAVHADRLELAGRTLHLDGLAAGLEALHGDVPQARLIVDFDRDVDALRRQKVLDLVNASAIDQVALAHED